MTDSRLNYRGMTPRVAVVRSVLVVVLVCLWGANTACSWRLDLEACTADEDCNEGWVCTDDALCVEAPDDDPPCDDIGGYVELMWSDFEDEEFTNVEGFREPRDDRTDETNLEEAGLDESTVVQLDYEMEADAERATGYRLYAFPNADVSEYTHFVIRLRSEQRRSIRIEMRDTDTIDDEGVSVSLEVGPLWRQIEVPLEEFQGPEGEPKVLNTGELQLIEVLFEPDKEPLSGTVYIDRVGFNRVPELGVDEFLWSDFEIEDVTNAEGFREPINDETDAEDIPEMGQHGGTVVGLEFEIGVEDTTGYRLFAYPNADISAFAYMVMRIRADRQLFNTTLEFFDDREQPDRGYGRTDIRIGTQWEHLIIPLDQLETPENAEPPDMSALQLINILFDGDRVCPEAATVYVDWVRFRTGS